jgi:hypothetical protein
MAAPYSYYLEGLSSSPAGGWFIIPGTLGNKSYVNGWFDAVTSFLPHPAYRIKCYETGKVVEECKAAGKPTVSTN